MNPKQLIYGAVLTIGGLLAGSCAHHDPDAPDPALPEGSVYLTLQVRALDDTPPSCPDAAQAPAFEENDTTGFENPATDYEKMHTLRVIIVRPDGEVEYNRFLRITGAGLPQEPDDMTFIVKAGESKKVYLFANEAAVPYDFSQIRPETRFPTAEVEDIKLTTDEKGRLIDNSGTEKTYVPMSETFDITIKTPETNADFHQRADMFVTRAAVKFSFEVKGVPDLGFSPLYVNSVSVSGMSDKEYLLPRNTVYKPTKYEPSDHTLNGRFITDYEVPADTSLNVYTFSTPGAATLPLKAGQTAAYTPYVYLPESADTSAYSVSVDFRGGDSSHPEFTSVAKLPNLPSLPRNTHVKVVITVTKPQSVDMQVTVLPYLSVKLDPVFGL